MIELAIFLDCPGSLGFEIIGCYGVIASANLKTNQKNNNDDELSWLRRPRIFFVYVFFFLPCSWHMESGSSIRKLL